jgi:hypothetical protein
MWVGGLTCGWQTQDRQKYNHVLLDTKNNKREFRGTCLMKYNSLVTES